MAAHRKSDQRRDDLYEGGLRKRHRESQSRWSQRLVRPLFLKITSLDSQGSGIDIPPLIRFDSLRGLESKPNSKTVKEQMIRIGVIITHKRYSSVNGTAMARG